MAGFQSLPGFRDFYPEDFSRRQHIFRTWRQAAGSFGFQEWRREPEDPGRWFRTGYHSHAVFAGADQYRRLYYKTGFLRFLADKADFDAMQWCDAIVMVQPCGRSAALEVGWGTGAGKLTIALLADGQEPELMLKCCDHLAVSLDEVVSLLAQPLPLRRIRTLRRIPEGGPDGVVG